MSATNHLLLLRANLFQSTWPLTTGNHSWSFGFLFRLIWPGKVMRVKATPALANHERFIKLDKKRRHAAFKIPERGNYLHTVSAAHIMDHQTYQSTHYRVSEPSSLTALNPHVKSSMTKLLMILLSPFGDHKQYQISTKTKLNSVRVEGCWSSEENTLR